MKTVASYLIVVLLIFCQKHKLIGRCRRIEVRRVFISFDDGAVWSPYVVS